jgi:hypothetical protein
MGDSCDNSIDPSGDALVGVNVTPVLPTCPKSGCAKIEELPFETIMGVFLSCPPMQGPNRKPHTTFQIDQNDTADRAIAWMPVKCTTPWLLSAYLPGWAQLDHVRPDP